MKVKPPCVNTSKNAKNSLTKVVDSSFFSGCSSAPSLEASLRSASLLELSGKINVDSNFTSDLKSIYIKTRFSIDMETCVLFRFVNGLWWEAMTIIQANKFVEACQWEKLPKNQFSTVDALFEMRQDGFLGGREGDSPPTDIASFLSHGNLHSERFKTKHGGTAFKPSGQELYSPYDTTFLTHVGAIISFCVDKDISSRYLGVVYQDLQVIVDKLKKPEEDEVHPAMYTDTDTGLHSRLGLIRIIKHLIDNQQSNSYVVVLSVEKSSTYLNLLDEEIKQSFLKEAIDRFKETVPKNNTLSYLDGHEFAFMMINASEPEVNAALTQIMEAFVSHFQVGDYKMHCELKAGYSCYYNGEPQPIELLRMASIALFQARHSQSERFVGYHDEIVQELKLHLELAYALPSAIENGEFEVHFQPIVRIDQLDEPAQHYEALIRWRHSEAGIIPPNQFIELAEKSGDIIELGYWVIDSVCRHLSGPTIPENVGVSVNLSPVQLRETDLVERVIEITNLHGIAPSRLTLEITESSAMVDSALTKEKFAKFHDSGFKLSMDDFGTGYSSLSYLLNFHFDILKVDKSFIDNTLTDDHYAIIGRTIVTLAHELSLLVICEGIETDGQFQMVKNWKSDMIQGYLISKPKPWEAFYKN